MSSPNNIGHSQNRDRNDRLVAFWEVLSVVVSVLLAEWAAAAFADRARLVAAIPILLAFTLIYVSHRLRGEKARELGFRMDNFGSASRLLFLPTLLAVLFIVLGPWFFGGGLHLRPWRARLWLVPVWALLQQYVLQGYVNRRAQVALGKGRRSILLVAVVFTVLHIPSPLLIIFSFVGGYVWAAIYQKNPNLFALACSHTLVSWALSLTIPQNLAQHLRIGFKFFGLDI